MGLIDSMTGFDFPSDPYFPSAFGLEDDYSLCL